MESKPNKHGVLIDGNDIILVENKDYRIIINVAEHRGLWRYGLDYWCGGTKTGAHGEGFAPSIKKHKGYHSEKECLDAAKTKMRQIIKDHIKRCSDAYPAVEKLAREALSFVPTKSN